MFVFAGPCNNKAMPKLEPFTETDSQASCLIWRELDRHLGVAMFGTKSFEVAKK